MPRFQICYWAYDAAPWKPFGGTVEASSAREAIEKVDPQAVGRYRVAPVGMDGSPSLFRVHLAAHECELIEVHDFPAESSPGAGEREGLPDPLVRSAGRQELPSRSR
jgi:hypothetical protein